jgi:tripartite-type tricarboxylate transporter receptor subunit TctC
MLRQINIMLSRKLWLPAAVAAVALAAVPPIAMAQSKYPTRPVRLIVPFPPAGAVDVVARPLAHIAGAGGNIGTGQAAKAAPDGYTILMAFSSYVVNATLYDKLSFDPYKDFEAVTLVVTTPTTLIVNPTVPAKTVKELVDLIKASPGKYSFAHAGPGTQGHLTGEQLRLKLGLDLVPVPFNGGGPTVVSVLGGHTPIGFVALGPALPNIKDGKLRALAVTGKARSPVLPDVPTMLEAGHPDIVGDNWVGVLVPTGTPAEITSLLHREFTQALRDPEMTQRLLAQGYEPVASTPGQFSELIKAEFGTWRNVIQAANIKMR